MNLKLPTVLYKFLSFSNLVVFHPIILIFFLSLLFTLHSIINKNKEQRAKERDAKKQQSQPTPSSAKSNSNSNSSALPVGPGSSITPANTAVPRPVPAIPPNVDRRHLHNYRVVQRNLVYIIGLPGTLVSEEMLRRPEYFGQYGRIGKIVIHKTHGGTGAGSSVTSVSAYVTFVHKEDAKASIQSLEGHWIDNHVLRASFGTTKYCNSFIRGLACNNPDCVYLHEMGNDEDRFTKAEIQAGHSKLAPVPGQNQQLVTGMGGPSGTGKAATAPVMPPPVFLKDVTPPEPALPSSSSGAALGKPNLQRSSSWNNNGQGVPVALTRSSSNGSENDTNKSQQVSNVSEQEPDIISSDKDGAGQAKDEKDSNSGKESDNSKTKGKEKGDSPASLKAAAKAAERDRIAADKRAAEKAQQEKLEKAEAAAKAAFAGDTKDSADVGSASKTSATAADVSPEGDKAPEQAKRTVERPSKTEDMGGLVSASFNGIGRCAVFTVPISSFAANTVWSAIINSSYNSTGDPANLDINPYLMTKVSVSELFDLTLPPVDAVGLPVWPKPASHYLKPMNTANLPPVQPQGMANQGNHSSNVQTSSGGSSTMPYGPGNTQQSGQNGQGQGQGQNNQQQGGQATNGNGQGQAQAQNRNGGIRTLQNMFPKARVSG